MSMRQNGESDTPTIKSTVMICKTSVSQTCMHACALQNGVDLYSNQGERLLCSLELALENRKKERLRNGHFFGISGSGMYNCFDE